MAWSLFELLAICAEFTCNHTDKLEESIHKELETSGATKHIDHLRMCRLQRAITSVGMFSMFEAALQGHYGYDRPFEALDKFLRKIGEEELAADFIDYKAAINVLKHGVGPSHKALMARKDALDFRVREPGTSFEEGDVSEIDILVDVDDDFVRRCAELVETASQLIQIEEGQVLRT